MMIMITVAENKRKKCFCCCVVVVVCCSTKTSDGNESFFTCFMSRCSVGDTYLFQTFTLKSALYKKPIYLKKSISYTPSVGKRSSLRSRLELLDLFVHHYELSSKVLTRVTYLDLASGLPTPTIY